MQCSENLADRVSRTRTTRRSIVQSTIRALITGATVSLIVLPAGLAHADGDSDTFSCDPGFYQVISGQFAEFDPGAGTYTRVGADLDNYNAMGYRIADGYIYGVGKGNLYRIDANGVRTVVGSLGSMPSGYTGAFGDDGLLHVSSGGRDWYTIDVDTMEMTSIPELSESLGMADITNVNGIFYGVTSRGDLIRVDPTALTIEKLGAVAGLPSHTMAYGAAWSTAGGNLYIGRNSGEIYQITGYSTGAPAATQVGAAPSTNSNDGASCELAPPPPGLADVDGPEPETTPSTPEAQAAADEYADEYVETEITIPDPTPIEPAAPTSDPDSPVYNLPDAGIGSDDACAPTVIVDRAPRGIDSTFTTVTAAEVLYTSTFSGALSTDWTTISGTWTTANGSLAQTETCDFDATVLLETHAVIDFRWEATFTGEATNQGGLLVNQQSATTRSGATLIDLSDDGTTVRWGSYDDRGHYVYVGGESIPAPAPGTAVTLAVEVHGSDIVIEVNGERIGELNTQYAGGLVGLVATQSLVSFSNATLTALPSPGAS